MKHFTASLLAALCLAPASMSAQSGVQFHGNVQSDILFPEADAKIGAKEYSEDVLTNTYASASMFSKYVDAGFRVEYLQHPLPGFLDISPDFKGWGVPNIYVKGKYKGFELTAGDFYEQFGSGFILRTYEERSLGIDNSIRGARVKVNAVQGLRLTALGGVQRRFWDWDKTSQLYGADAELDLQTYCESLRKQKISLTFGASYVLKHENDEELLVSGTNNKLHLPKFVNAFDLRAHFYCSGLDLLAEYAWKSQDPSFQNNYTYRRGQALMLSVGYSKTGYSMLLQAKRSDNMAFRSRRSEYEAASFINNMPPFAYQHTYALAALYPYATQDAPGEWAFQGAFAYTFKRGTALGGKYGTKLKLNASYICGIDRMLVSDSKDKLPGTDWYEPGTEDFGETYYTDVNLQMDKKLTKDFQFNLMYMYQKYNKTVVEGHGGMVNSNIFVFDGKYKFNKKLTLRGEVQYLQTRQDQKDWCYGLLELSVQPYLMFTVSDQWNHGSSGLHYYLASVTANYKGNRLLVGYGRTREGFNCSGGVCRYVPATRGFQISYTYNF